MKCVSLWLSKSFGRYANIENNNDDDGDGDGDGDGDDDPCKNALTAPEPLLVQEPKWGPGNVWEYKVLWLILNL